MHKHTSPKIVDPPSLYQLVCYTILIEAVGGYVPSAHPPKSNDDSLPCLLSFYS